MAPNDRILISALVGAIAAIVLVAYAPPMPPSYGVVDKLWAFASTNFFTACAGAFAGALGAQLISERGTRRKALLTEIKQTNAAISICLDTINAYLIFKKQIVLPVCEDYRRAQKAKVQFEGAMASGAIPAGTVFAVPLTLQIFEAPFAPIVALQQTIQERVIPEGPSFAFLTLLTQAVYGLNGVLAARNELIALIQKIPAGRSSEIYAIYFGVGLGDGITDGSYPSHMNALAQLTDDCIGIGILLSNLLQNYGRKLVRRYGLDAPKIVEVEWDLASEGVSLIPELDRYRSWLKTSFDEIR